MERKIQIWDIPVDKNRIVKTDIEIRQLNMYDPLEDCISYYVIENLIFISL